MVGFLRDLARAAAPGGHNCYDRRLWAVGARLHLPRRQGVLRHVSLRKSFPTIRLFAVPTAGAGRAGDGGAGAGGAAFRIAVLRPKAQTND